MNGDKVNLHLTDNKKSKIGIAQLSDKQKRSYHGIDSDEENEEVPHVLKEDVKRKRAKDTPSSNTNLLKRQKTEKRKKMK